MRNIKKILLTLIVMAFATKAFCATAWLNDLKSMFAANKAIIYSVNIRTFNSRDYNNNGIIEENLGEERGTFLNAIKRLDEFTACGINTVLLMPVTKTGKIKAIGTAGSLYAPASFDEISPLLKSPNSKLSAKDEMAKFVDECHKRNIRVMVDLPACASYDLYLKNPDLFVKDKNNNPVTPADWTDVRLLDAGDNNHINIDVYNLYAGFTDLMLDVGVDGIRANVASIKPYTFWKKLIDETKARDPQFLFLAEASDLQKSPCEYAIYTPYNKLLDAGFDGYYGNYSGLKDWKNASELYNNVKTDIEIQKKHLKTKSVLGSFSTHDQVSPILINGTQYSKMIMWLNATLPVNSYFIDGFSTGDTYIYPLMNKKANNSYTDDEYYFVHRGQMDIFNLSKICLGQHYELLQDFVMANKLKSMMSDVISNGDFIPLKTSSPNVFAYERRLGEDILVVFGNLNFKKSQEVEIRAPKINNEIPATPIKLENIPRVSNGKIKAILNPGEVNIILFNIPQKK